MITVQPLQIPAFLHLLRLCQESLGPSDGYDAIAMSADQSGAMFHATVGPILRVSVRLDCVEVMPHSQTKAAFNPSTLAAWVSGRTEPVRISVFNGQKRSAVCLASGPARHELAMMEYDQHPINRLAAPNTDDLQVTIAADDLARILSGVAHAVSRDQTRYGLAGFNLEFPGEGTIMACGTDGNRLATESTGCTVHGDPKVLKGQLLAPKAVSAMLPALTLAGKEPVTLSFGERAWKLESKGIIMGGALLDGQFPDWRQVLPTGHIAKAVVSIHSLTDAIRRVLPACSQKVKSISLSVDVGEFGASVEVRAVNPNMTSVELVDLDSFDGQKRTDGMNANYLLDALKSLGSELATIEFGRSLAPVLLRATDNPERGMRIVMPVRLD